MSALAPKSFLARLSRAFNLLEYLQAEPRKPKKYGSSEWAIDCPICGPDGYREKLWCNVDKRTAYCYYCQKGYDVVALIRLLEDCNLLRAIEVLKDHSAGASVNLRQEVDRVMKALGKDDSGEDQDVIVLPTVTLPRGFIAACDADKLPRYFKERQINRARAVRYDLGWTEEGFYRNRLVVPVVQEGRLVTFHARYMQKKPPITDCESCGGEGIIDKEVCSHCDGTRRSRPKKVRYPKGSKTSYMLYNYDRARHCKRIVILEDTFSTMAVGVGRITGGMGSFGTSISPHQLAMLLGTDAEEIVLMWDEDAIEKAHEEAERLGEFWKTRVVELPDTKDPDDYPYPQRPHLLKLIEKTTASGSARFSARVKARMKKIA